MDEKTQRYIEQVFRSNLYNAALDTLAHRNPIGDARKFESGIAGTFAMWGVEAFNNLLTEALAQAREIRAKELAYSGLKELDDGGDRDLPASGDSVE